MMPVLDPAARARIQSELQPGERLLWAGQPVPALFARGAWAIISLDDGRDGWMAASNLISLDPNAVIAE